MDLGLEGLRAIVCGGSRGLGFGCAMALAGEGAQVTIAARRLDVLAGALDAIRARTGAQAVGVVADVATGEGQDALLAACPRPDILVTSAGGSQPRGDFRRWSAEDWTRSVQALMQAPIALIGRCVEPMVERGFGRIVNIVSGAAKMPPAAETLSIAPRVGLIGYAAAVSRALIAHGVTVNTLLPGTHATDRLERYIAARAKEEGVDLAEAERRSRPQAGRWGDPADFGAVCAFLCSRQANYITGQSILVDGGRFPGLF
jgi:3-oxoacyl-[acyl-carrier protein] reductase